MIRRLPVAPAPTITVLDYVRSLLTEMDLRYQQRFDGQNKAVDAALLAAGEAVTVALTAAERAVTKAEAAAEKRFDWVNEMRAVYEEMMAQQMTRVEVEQRFAALRVDIAELKKHDQSRLGHAAGARSLWGYAVGVVGLVAASVAIFVGLR